MRPLLLLLLVLGVCGALYLALHVGADTSDGSDAIGHVGRTPAPVEPGVAPITLQGEQGDGVRKDVKGPAVGKLPSEARFTAPTAGSGTVLGRVVDGEGSGVGDAEVVLTEFGMNDFLSGSAHGDRAGDRTTSTSANGEFRFDKVAPHDGYSIIVRHADYSPHEVDQVRVDEGEVSEEPAIVLRKGVRLFGTVFDAGGNVVPSASLTLGVTALSGQESSRDPSARGAVSDAQGAFEFKNLAQGTFALTVSADGYGRVSIRQVSVVGDEDIERDVVLEAASALGGRVVSSVDGQPIADASITAYSLGAQESRTQSATTSDARGEFVFQDIPDGSYMLRVTAGGFEALPVPRVQSGEMSLTLALVSLPKVRGRVLDPSGQPVTKFTAQLRQGIPNSDTSMKASGTAREFESADGRFELDCPMAGEFFVDAGAPGFANSFSDPFTIAKAQELPGVLVTMSAGGTILGVVVDAGGKPVKNAWVQTRDNRWTGSMFDQSLAGFFPGVAVERRVRTNERGEFSIDSLTPTTYLVEITHRKFSKTVVRDIAVAEGIETDIRRATIHGGGTVAGTVRGSNGAPLPGAKVSMTFEGLGPDDFPIYLQAKCDKDGKYSFAHVKAGAYSIQASPPGPGGPFGGNPGATPRRRITVDEGGASAGVDFSLVESHR